MPRGSDAATQTLESTHLSNSTPPTIVVAEPIDAVSFAPFGDIIDASGAPDYHINDALCERYHDRARLAVDAQGRLGLSVFNSQCFSLPLTVEAVERHPLASQTFVPMSDEPFLVVVAPDENGVPQTPRAFVTERGQAINLLRGTWHGVLRPLGRSGLFAVFDRVGAGENCEAYSYPQPFLVEARQ